MISPLFITHASRVFQVALATAALLGLLRAAAPRISREQRGWRLVGTPLVFFAWVMAAAHAASFAPPTNAPAMALAFVSPVSREIARRKVRDMIRASEKTAQSVETLVLLDLAAGDCEGAQADAYHSRARSSWPAVSRACGPSDMQARALFEDGELEEAAVVFEAVRAGNPTRPISVDELTSYALTKRASVASAALRVSAKGLPPGGGDNERKCLAEAFERVAGLRHEWTEPVLSSMCVNVHHAVTPEASLAPSESGPGPFAGCVPHQRTDRPSRGCGFTGREDLSAPSPFAAAGDEPARHANWLSQLDDTAGALAVVDRQLAGFAWGQPLYTREQHERHSILFDQVQAQDAGNIWVRADCTEEMRVPANHPLAKEVAADRALYDPSRGTAEIDNEWARNAALEHAYRIALDGLDGERARGYRARHSRTEASVTFLGDTRLPLLLAYSPADVDAALRDQDAILREAAKAGSGARIADRLRAQQSSGLGILDVVGKTIPEGREALRAFLAFDARLDCHRTAPAGLRCTALSLVRALGERHRMARAVGDALTLRESEASLARLLQHGGGAWLRDTLLLRVLDLAHLELMMSMSAAANVRP